MDTSHEQTPASATRVSQTDLERAEGEGMGTARHEGGVEEGSVWERTRAAVARDPATFAILAAAATAGIVLLARSRVARALATQVGSALLTELAKRWLSGVTS